MLFTLVYWLVSLRSRVSPGIIVHQASDLPLAQLTGQWLFGRPHPQILPKRWRTIKLRTMVAYAPQGPLKLRVSPPVAPSAFQPSDPPGITNKPCSTNLIVIPTIGIIGGTPKLLLLYFTNLTARGISNYDTSAMSDVRYATNLFVPPWSPNIA